MRFRWGVALLVLFVCEATAQQRGLPERSATIQVRELAALPPLAGIPRVKPRPLPGPARAPAATIQPAPRAVQPRVASSTGVITTDFRAELDDLTAAPPDTTGAVGPAHIVTMLNSQVQFQTRSGTVLSSLQLEQFWSGAGPFRQFATDPHILYDRTADRWVSCVLADPSRNTAALLLGVSQTGDPTGGWTQYRIPVDPQGLFNGDYPLLGLNGTWVVLTLDLFRRNTFDHSNIYVFGKSQLYAAGADLPPFTQFSDPGFTWFPAFDYDNSTAALYLVSDQSGRRAQLAVAAVKGPVGSETFTVQSGVVTAPEPWSDDSPASNGNFAPQLNTTQKIDTGDSRLGNCLLRNGSIWCAHTVFLPANAPARSAAQWIQFDPATLQVQQFGRMDDPTGVNFYAYPTIAVNRSNDALLGFNRFSANQYPSADYALRSAADPPDTLGPDTVIKAGQYFYRLTGTGTLPDNRWGDYSTTLVDPADDLTFWTIQEYAAAPDTNGTPRWGTWWASVSPAPPAGPVPAITPSGVVNAASFQPGPVTPGEIVTIFGTNLGPAAPAVATAPFGPAVANTRVLFDGMPAPVIYASSKQTSAVVPFALPPGGSTQLQVEYLGAASAPVRLPLALSAPGLFTVNASGSGQGAILNQNGGINSPSSPAAPGSVIQMFGTGAGLLNPPAADSELAQAPLAKLVEPVSVQIGGQAAQVQYAGPAPGLVNGALQINAVVPAGIRGSAPVIVTIGGASSPPVTVAVGP